MITSIRRISLIAICFCVLFAKAGVAQVVGFSGVLESTTASEIDGWSETDIDYNSAYYYNVAVIGYLYQDGTQQDIKGSDADSQDPCTSTPDFRCNGPIPPPIVWAGVETTSSVHQGSVYTVYSEHYLEAFIQYSDGTWYNPSQYSPGAYFSSPGGGDPTGTGYDPGGGPVYVAQEIIYLGYTYFQFSTAPPSIANISPSYDFRGASGTIHVKGQNLKDDLGRIDAYFRDSDITASVNVNAADASQADVSYNISATASMGSHQLVVSNTWGESEPSTFSVVYPPATITGIFPDTWTAGQSYTGVQITGTNFGSAPVVTLSDPTISSGGTYNTSTTNGVSTTYINLTIPSTTPSEPVVVTLTPGPYTQVSGGPPLPASGTATVVGVQQNACPADLDQTSGFSGITSTGLAVGGSGTMGISFSGGSFNGYGVTVPYGQYSTPESIASHLAALITQRYYGSGLSAEAYGAYILYKSRATLILGTPSFTSSGSSSGPSFTADPSPQSCAPVSMKLRLVPVVSQNERQSNGQNILLHNVWRLVTLDGQRALPINYTISEHTSINRGNNSYDPVYPGWSTSSGENPNQFDDGIGCTGSGGLCDFKIFMQKFTISSPNNGSNVPVTNLPVMILIPGQVPRFVMTIHDHGTAAPTMNDDKGPINPVSPNPYNDPNPYPCFSKGCTIIPPQ